MRTAIAVLCFLFSIAAFLNGLITEYRQSRKGGPIAIVPTLPSAAQGALMIALGLFWLPTPVPWWAYPVAFFGATAVYGFFIHKATYRRKTGDSS